ncbi:transcription antitermination factor NusB [Candidatus Uabimicrobium sp. HlEnr_7]|uniref:transcription antitermination factor NusB n=1 Tax=Candidatus Uabimicrobium helgolandensis TaxID=3095367 RepID=UPI003556F441
MYQVRDIVLNILNKNNRFWDQNLQQILQQYATTQNDKNLITEIVNGIHRRKLTLQYLIEYYSHAKPQIKIYNCLLLAIYELLYLEKTPAYAVIHSCVEQSKKISKKAGKYTNAILRNIQRDTKKQQAKHAQNYLPISQQQGWVFAKDIFPKDNNRYLSIVYSYPKFLVEKWSKHFGKQQCLTLLQMGNTRPNITARVRNHLEDDSLTMINEKMAQINASGSISKLNGHYSGDWIIQGAASIETIELMQIKKHSSVLDLCAAPGGKSFHIADNMENTGFVVACDKSVERLKKLHDNQQRLKIKNIYSVALNSKKLPKGFDDKFDYVLIDAPCSNSAVFNKRVEARWRFSAKSLKQLSQEQYELLKSGAFAVKPGGMLVYSTCSVEPEENADLVTRFLNDNTQFTCIQSKIMLPELPFVDGGSVHILQKSVQ